MYGDVGLVRHTFMYHVERKKHTVEVSLTILRVLAYWALTVILNLY